MCAERNKSRRARRETGTKPSRTTSDLTPALDQVVTHLRAQPPRHLALDGAFDAANPTAQATIWQALTTLDVDADALLDVLSHDEATQQLASEVVAAQRLRHWKVIDPYYRKLWTLFGDLRVALEGKQLPLPESVEELFLLLCEKLSAPARLDPGPRGALSPAKVAELRRKDSASAALYRRIGPIGETTRAYEKSLTAIRQRLMPAVRRTVYQHLRPVVERDTEQARRRKYPQATTRAIREQAARSVNTRTCKLTAEFICAFYPLFGEGTTAEHVRKAVASTPA